MIKTISKIAKEICVISKVLNDEETVVIAYVIDSDDSVIVSNVISIDSVSKTIVLESGFSVSYENATDITQDIFNQILEDMSSDALSKTVYNVDSIGLVQL